MAKDVSKYIHGFMRNIRLFLLCHLSTVANFGSFFNLLAALSLVVFSFLFLFKWTVGFV